MHGFETDHEFTYVILKVFKHTCGFKRFSSFEPSLVGHGTPPYPRDLRPWPAPTSEGQFGELLWENSNNASDIIKFLLFLNFSWVVIVVVDWLFI